LGIFEAIGIGIRGLVSKNPIPEKEFKCFIIAPQAQPQDIRFDWIIYRAGAKSSEDCQSFYIY
jgi:hypothetical protein